MCFSCVAYTYLSDHNFFMFIKFSAVVWPFLCRGFNVVEFFVDLFFQMGLPWWIAIGFNSFGYILVRLRMDIVDSWGILLLWLPIRQQVYYRVCRYGTESTWVEYFIGWEDHVNYNWLKVISIGINVT